MIKKWVFLLVALALFAGCVSEAEQTKEIQPGIVIREIFDKGFYEPTYKTSWGSDYKADTDKMWLVLYFTVENIDCRDFHISSQNFIAVIDNVEYSAKGYIGDKSFPSVTLQKGGKAEGYVCFEVPNKEQISYHAEHRHISSCPIDMKIEK